VCRVEDSSGEPVLVHVGVKLTHPHTTAKSIRALVDHNYSWDVYHLKMAVQFKFQEANVLN
jgi:hypothetical protein